MLKQWLMFSLLAAGLVLFGLALPSSSTYGKPPKDGKGKEGPDAKAGKDLRKAYDAIADATAQMNNTREKLPRQWSRVLDDAKDFYRAAKNSYDGGDTYRAGELAKAAHDAGRGLRHLLRATLPPVAGLPAPPADAGPPPGGKKAPPQPAMTEAEAVAAILQTARDRIVTARNDASGAGRDFVDASSDAYDQARRAYIDRDYDRAAEMARGAEAWTHVPEHLYLGRYETRGPSSERRPSPAPTPAIDDRSRARRAATVANPPPPPPLPPR